MNKAGKFVSNLYGEAEYKSFLTAACTWAKILLAWQMTGDLRVGATLAVARYVPA